jgi:hypothetical protein
VDQPSCRSTHRGPEPWTGAVDQRHAPARGPGSWTSVVDQDRGPANHHHGPVRRVRSIVDHEGELPRHGGWTKHWVRPTWSWTGKPSAVDGSGAWSTLGMANGPRQRLLDHARKDAGQPGGDIDLHPVLATPRGPWSAAGVSPRTSLDRLDHRAATGTACRPRSWTRPRAADQRFRPGRTTWTTLDRRRTKAQKGPWTNAPGDSALDPRTGRWSTTALHAGLNPGGAGRQAEPLVPERTGER